MKRVVLCLAMLCLFAPSPDAAAIPIEYHIRFALAADGTPDFLGVDGATFDLWTTLDPALAGPSDARTGRSSWSVQPGTRFQIAGSAGYDGMYSGGGWQIGIGNDSSVGDYVVLQEFYATIRGHRLNLGAIVAQLPSWTTNPGPGDPLMPFAFNSADVIGWSFSWADSVENGSRYRPTAISGSASAVGVPEPSSLVLLGLGAAAMAMRSVRRRRRLS